MWLGNENIYQLLQAYGSTECELWVEVHAFDGDVCSAKCYPFQMSAEATGYRLDWTTIDKLLPDISDGLEYHKNTSFSTFDKINCPQRCRHLQRRVVVCTLCVDVPKWRIHTYRTET